MTGADALRLHPSDNVAVMLCDAAAGATVRVRSGETSVVVTARDAVPLGHKIALAATARDDAVVKYGAVIASALRDIGVGEHVHVHNIASRRARAA